MELEAAVQTSLSLPSIRTQSLTALPFQRHLQTKRQAINQYVLQNAVLTERLQVLQLMYFADIMHCKEVIGAIQD